VKDLINHLYTVFARYPKPYDFAACECCTSDDEKTALLTPPLRELTADQLGRYASNAFFTMAEVSDFKYFLPRILELTVRDEFLWPDPEIVTRKLALAGWCDWPAEEQIAVSKVLKAKFETLLTDQNSSGSEVDTWVCALGRCLPDPTPFLDPLLESQHEDKLLAFIAQNGSLFTKDKLDNPFWEDARENEQRVVRWLHQPAVTQLLSRSLST